eukprot:gb/GECG01001708.1/.p1 GENE.gb/GECG01001708.1/~~gb/GECG01001708.1/.p1  ORF type:complete len:163 (+),score=6.00 gb/GECG01001708.1/:1-489(+)
MKANLRKFCLWDDDESTPADLKELQSFELVVADLKEAIVYTRSNKQNFSVEIENSQLGTSASFGFLNLYCHVYISRSRHFSNAGKSVFRLYRTNVQCSDGCEVFVANQTNIGPHNFVGNLIISDIKTDRNNIWSSRANLVNHLCHLHCRRGSLTREEHPCFR